MKKEMTGYPSKDMPWLKYYRPGVYEKTLSTYIDKTVYRFYMENVFIEPTFPLFKYFNTTLTTKQFIELIETWARAFRAVGVKPDEMVPVYGTWSPEIAAIFFALNAIGAHPYFEKLDITEKALRRETDGARVGVVFEALWNDVAKAVFDEKRFEKVFMIGLSDSMSFPLNLLIKAKSKDFRCVKDNKKYLFKNDVIALARSFSGTFEVPFSKDRIALITTSSGTTSDNVKGIMDTNEGALLSVIGSALSEPRYIAGKECLITLPPTASTAINCFFLLPLYMGMSLRIDPRADEENWTKIILKHKPSISLSTGSMWYSFFRRIDDMKKRGKRIDLRFLDTVVLGGSGVTPKQLEYMNKIARECNAPNAIQTGYGCSEYFGVITFEKSGVECVSSSRSVISVGVPMVGAVVGIFDEKGTELPYGKRGEIRAKGPSVMHGYFNQPELTGQIISGEWLKTGDLGKMDENGFVYCYGRLKSSIECKGETVYLFDIANALRNEFELEDCMAEVKQLEAGKQAVVIYYVQDANHRQPSREVCMKINRYTSKLGVEVDGYMEFEEAFPISPTTLKPKTRYTEGFINYLPTGQKVSIRFSPTDVEGVVKKEIV